MHTEKNRIEWVDIAKGYGIVFLILAHLGIGSTWIMTFNVPLFFFLSGYVFSTKYDFRTFVKRRFKSIIIPYFLLGGVMVAFITMLNARSDGFDIKILLSLFCKLIIQRRFLTLWYIACLFFLNIVFYGLVKIFKTFRSLFLVVVCMLIGGLLYYHFGGVALPWNIDVILTASLFFFGGFWFKSNYTKICKYLDRNKSMVLFGILAIINVVGGYSGIRIAGKGLDMFNSSYGFPPVTLLSTVAGVGCVVMFSHWFNPPGIKYIGRNSLIYYAWHQTIMIPIVRFLLQIVGISAAKITNHSVWIAEQLMELFIVIVLLTICNLVISRTRLKVMIGR
jgi:fucose 4-O-acetylase-like acetyltransferase